MLCRALLHFPQANPVDPVASWRNCLCYRNCLSKELVHCSPYRTRFLIIIISRVHLFHFSFCLQYLLLFVFILISECFISSLFSLSRSFCCFFPCICLYLRWVCLDYSDYEFGFELFHVVSSSDFFYLSICVFYKHDIQVRL